MTENADKTIALTEKCGELAPATMTGADRIYSILECIARGQLTPESAATAEKMADLMLKLKAVDAREAYFAAKAALQAELPRVEATKSIPNKDGTVRSRYAPYDEIMAAIRPFLVRHGFSVSFDARLESDGRRLTAICIVSHVGGHSERNEFAVRTSAPPGCSDAQADGSTMSYAQRYALLAAFGIAVAKDTDARIEGGSVTPEVAEELEAAVAETGSNRELFLKFAGVDVTKILGLPEAGREAAWHAAFRAIPEGRVDELRRELARKRAAKEAKGDRPPATRSQSELPY
jgi:hypothetical protein